MKNAEPIYEQLGMVQGGMTELAAMLAMPKPVSKAYIRGVLEDLQVHLSAALFQLDCLTADAENFNRALPKK